jgi:SAM-dependent methyltransferase
MTAFKDHFSTRSAEYAAYRPTYPRTLVDFLADAAGGTELALDCGCGTGQLSVLLCERFARVVATDASEKQIDNAEPHARVAYRARRRKRAASARQAPTSSLPRRRRIGSTFRPSTPRRGAWRARGGSSRS